MGIRYNGGGGGSGAVSGGGSGSGENGSVSDGFIFEGDGSVGSVITSIIVYIVGFFILTYFYLSRCQLQTYYFFKQKNKVTRWWGEFITNLYFIIIGSHPFLPGYLIPVITVNLGNTISGKLNFYNVNQFSQSILTSI